MERSIEKVFELLTEPIAQTYPPLFQRVQEMQGADSLFERIASAKDEETLWDYLAEVRYALVFDGLGFQVEIEPLGKEGPDLKVSRDDHQMFVEVARFRLAHPGPPLLDLSGEVDVLPEYGNIKRDTIKARRKIYGKFAQLGEGDSIIAIWNDDEDLEEFEVGAAVHKLLHDSSVPSGLAFVIYGSKWVLDNQFYCFQLRYPFQEHHMLWQREFQESTSTVSKLIQRALIRSNTQTTSAT